MALRRVQGHLEEHGLDYFPALKEITKIRIERVKEESTNPLRRFVLSDGTQNARVIAKWAPVYCSNNEGLTEYRHYHHFNAEFHGAVPFSCPRPLAFIESDGVLLTEEKILSPLVGLLRFRRQSRTTERAVRLSAKWLAAFHKLTCSEPKPVGLTWRGIERSSPWITDRYLEREDVNAIVGPEIRGRILRVRSRFRSGSFLCRMGGVHRDFGPGNIGVSIEGVTVFDAAYNRQGPQLLDVADFITYLGLLPTFGLRSARICRGLTNAFLEAYFETSPASVDETIVLKMLAIGSLVRSLDRHLSISRRFPCPLESIFKSWLARMYRTCFDSTVAAAERLPRHQFRPHSDTAQTMIDPKLGELFLRSVL